MDWTPVTQAAITAAATIVSAAGLVIAAYIRTYVKNEALAAILIKAEKVGAGVAHDSLITAVAKGAPDWGAAKRVAVAEGTAAAQSLVASVTTDGVLAALAPLLAVDPSVPAGTASTATATASKGGAASASAEGASTLVETLKGS